MRPILRTRGHSHGTCNMCGKTGKLTEDHTPPKGCKKPSQINLLHIGESLGIEATHKGRILQDGVKYRTLCERCNSYRLGQRYDPEFIKFVNTIGTFLTTSISLPNAVPIIAKPQKILRALVGHMSAQGVDRYDKGRLTEELTAYLTDENKPFPNGVKAYVWAYPYRQHLMARDCEFFHLGVKKAMPIWFLKFFPVGFMLTFDEPDEYTFDFEELSKWRHLAFGDDAEVVITLRPLTHPGWPESPTEKSLIMYGQEAVASFNWKNGKS